MPNLQKLSPKQMQEAIEMACQRQVPATISICVQNCWLNLHSRLLSQTNDRLMIQVPCIDQGGPQEFVRGEKIGLNFKLRHHKHIAFANVIGMEQMTLTDGQTVPVLSISLPESMERLQRRAFYRATVPPNRVVRASIWLGGIDAEPTGTTKDRPVWSGRVANLSAGGFQMQASPQVAQSLEEGDIVGVHISFGSADETIFSDAQFRHGEIGKDGASLGFQFVGLGYSEQGRAALQLISAKVGEYQRAELHNHALGV